MVHEQQQKMKMIKYLKNLFNRKKRRNGVERRLSVQMRSKDGVPVDIEMTEREGRLFIVCARNDLRRTSGCMYIAVSVYVVNFMTTYMITL